MECKSSSGAVVESVVGVCVGMACPVVGGGSGGNVCAGVCCVCCGCVGCCW